MKLPFLQFYPSDYMRDTRVLSLAAKGGWMDILCMLHGSSTRGSLALPMVGWARVMGATVDQADAVIAELEMLGIADVTREGNGNVTLSSRRMQRETITREQTRLRVQRHRSNKARNANGNGNETPKKSETRNQKSETIDQTLGNPAISPPPPTPPEKPAVAGPASDKEWLDSLSAQPAYQGINVPREYARMVVWCETNKKQPTRRRFVNWLNRCERPLALISSKPDDDMTPEDLARMRAF